MQSLSDRSALNIAINEGNILVLKSQGFTFTAVPAGRMEMRLAVIFSDEVGDHEKSELIPYATEATYDLPTRYAAQCRHAFVRMVRALRDDNQVQRWMKTS